MKLSQLFSGEVHTDNTSHAPQPTPAQAEQMSRQIRSLVPGQTISGEIVARNGNEVQIRLSEDMVLNARIDRNMNIEIGRNMTFEVKNNGSALTLSPLFTNVATDVNVMKALDMAGLPLNRTTVDMTEQLMAAGLSVNKGSLQQVFREINSFPQATVADIVNLHKLQMPVNEANVNQMVSYRNLTHQLMGGMEDILGVLPEVFDSMMAEGNVAGAVRLYQEVLSLIREAGQGDGTADGAGAARGDVPLQGGEAGAVGENGQQAAGGVATGIQAGAIADGAVAETLLGTVGDGTEKPADGAGAGAAGQAAAGEAQIGSRGEPLVDGIQGSLRAAVAQEAMELVDSLRLPPEEASQLRSQIQQFAGGQTEAFQLFSRLAMVAEGARTSSRAMQALERLFSGENFRAFIAGGLKAGWMLRPEELAVPGRVEELYRRLDRQLRGLTSALENAGQGGSEAFRATASLSQNVDFLQQLNQMYSYVQLPLHLQQRDAHGDLYVYTNKKNLARKDGNVSALLHLDMENLGPVDVYVAMQNSKVSTKFYLRDDEMIDFMAAHMDILTERLRKRGYDCSYSMAVREEKASGAATKGGLEPLLKQERGVMLSRYAFDVRT
ncbi:MAG: flagellar hook-length control protein FliK [Lachnospiraceae bacterium]|nr:flagellar hook-length control protein FliK [uncultured Acetatifactor sp.]MCI9230300.1 flagellar hook-length control protein FliK [Lachnospiraceae bacterium]